ncbi:oxidoreductase [Nitzschia inconspicua]|uniref:Oxidoreductase n=1 Tax=Nitzschia inconspicua TaxID=303405 RepID=A0A9K3Q365_9STRA|nr:oxidoreductase [Nitzschia inconspicua]
MFVSQKKDKSDDAAAEADDQTVLPTSSPLERKSSFRVRELIKRAKPGRKAASSPAGTSDERNDDGQCNHRDKSTVAFQTTDCSQQRQGDDNIDNDKMKEKTSSNRDKSLLPVRLGGDKRQKKAVITKFSKDPHEAIEMTIQDIPEPVSADHVVIKVTASTVSLFDCLIRKGVSYEMVDLPVTPGMDVVGNIIKCGEHVHTFRVGDRVAALVLFGGNARYVNVLASNLVQVPRSCDAAETACMVSTYMTAYQALRLVTGEHFSLAGKRILITGGVDAVGQALVQLCQRAGASEVYATAPMMRHKYVQGVLGAHPLSPNPEEWPETIVKGRMHAVFDGTSQAPYHALTNDGTLVSLGESALMNQQSTPGLLGAPVSAYWARMKGNILPNTKVYDLWDSFMSNKDAFKMDFEILLHLLKKRFIKPHIAKRISLNEVAESHASLERENPRGVIVCLPWKKSSTKGARAAKDVSKC